MKENKKKLTALQKYCGPNRETVLETAAAHDSAIDSLKETIRGLEHRVAWHQEQFDCFTSVV